MRLEAGATTAWAINRNQPHPEPLGDLVVGMTTESAIPVAVEVEDGCSVAVAAVIKAKTSAVA